MKYDFSGYATRANMKCSDGRVIMKDAFKHDDGLTVPLVWNHQHNEASNVLGHALLENRDDGVYAYCSFNDTDDAMTARELVRHGDIDSLSIYANQLKQQGPNVMHGEIREVSLVLAGANPGAYIDSVVMHGSDGDEEGMIYTDDLYRIDPEGGDVTVAHSDMQTQINNKEDNKMAAGNQNEEKTIQDVFDTLTEEQKNVVDALVGAAIENNNDDEGGEEEMKQNAFDMDGY